MVVLECLSPLSLPEKSLVGKIMRNLLTSLRNYCGGVPDHSCESSECLTEKWTFVVHSTCVEMLQMLRERVTNYLSVENEKLVSCFGHNISILETEATKY